MKKRQVFTSTGPIVPVVVLIVISTNTSKRKKVKDKTDLQFEAEKAFCLVCIIIDTTR
jgi:hypothetical protein